MILVYDAFQFLPLFTIFTNKSGFLHQGTKIIKIALPNIEITTTQNVTVQHELATVTDRFLAGFIDAILITVFAILIGLLIESAGSESGEWFIMVVLGVPFIWFYTLTSESIMNGQTIGKKLLRIKVIRLDGKPLTFVDHFTRWSSRLVDIYASATSLGMIMMISSERRQRLGGIISGTVVIRQHPRHHFSLQKIKNLTQFKDSDIQFPQVSQMTENQMIQLKRLLDRKKRYGSDVYDKLLFKTSEKIKKDLQIDSSEKPDKLMRQLLKDYIVLSR